MVTSYSEMRLALTNLIFKEPTLPSLKIPGIGHFSIMKWNRMVLLPYFGGTHFHWVSLKIFKGGLSEIYIPT